MRVSAVVALWAVLCIGAISASRLSILEELENLLDDLAEREADHDEELASIRSTQTCGDAPLARVVGGVEVNDNGYPWQALMLVDDVFSCGGSVIGKKWILTAAHCFEGGVAASSLKIYLGSHDQYEYGDNEVGFDVKKIYKHSGWDVTTYDNDIAILKLKTSITYDDYIQPICLTNNDIADGKKVIVTGWGNTEEDGSPSPVLLEGVMYVVNFDDCNLEYDDELTSNMFCAAASGVDSCQGDSGGPLVHKEGSIYKQYGVVSFGTGCADPDYSGVYTRLSKYIDWIEDITGENDIFVED